MADSRRSASTACAVIVREQDDARDTAWKNYVGETFVAEHGPNRNSEEKRGRERRFYPLCQAQGLLRLRQANGAGAGASEQHARVWEIVGNAAALWIEKGSLHRYYTIIVFHAGEHGGPADRVSARAKRRAGMVAERLRESRYRARAQVRFGGGSHYRIGFVPQVGGSRAHPGARIANHRDCGFGGGESLRRSLMNPSQDLSGFAAGKTMEKKVGVADSNRQAR